MYTFNILDHQFSSPRNSSTWDQPGPGKARALGDVNDLDGGFKYFLCSPLPGEMIQFDQYFSNGLKPPTSPGPTFQISGEGET